MMLHTLVENLNQYRGKHLLFEDEQDKRIALIKSHPFFADKLKLLQEIRSELLKESITVLPFSKYRIFSDTGSRREYEELWFRRRLRLEVFAFFAFINADPIDLRELEDILFEICNEYTWAFPAHIREIVKNGDYDPKTELDLFASETAFMLAEIGYLLKGKLSQEIQRRIREEVFLRVLNPYLRIGRFSGWEAGKGNWPSVCGSSIGAAAIYLLADTETLAPFVLRVCATLDGYLDSFPEDGACTEGYNYWNYGFGHFAFFARLLKNRTNGTLDLFHEDEKVARIASYQEKCFLIKDAVASFADSFIIGRHSMGLTHLLAREFPNLAVLSSQYRLDLTNNNYFKWTYLIRDFLWTDPEMKESGVKFKTEVLPDSEIIISRKRCENVPIAFAVKGGHNNEYHNHNDVGTFILNIDGDSLIADTGMGEYTRDYFSKDRYALFVCGSQGHNLPIINGNRQQEGERFRTRNFSYEEINGKLSVGMELASAYPDMTVSRFKRELTFQEEPTCLVLEDQFGFKEAQNSVAERFITFHDAEVHADGSVTILGTRQLKISPDKKVMASVKKEEYYGDHHILTTVSIIEFTAHCEQDCSLRFELTLIRK